MHSIRVGGWVGPGVGEGVVGAPWQQGLLWAMNVQNIKVKGFDNLVGCLAIQTYCGGGV